MGLGGRIMANRQAVILENAAKISNAQAAQCSSDFTRRKGIFIETGIFLQNIGLRSLVKFYTVPQIRNAESRKTFSIS